MDMRYFRTILSIFIVGVFLQGVILFGLSVVLFQAHPLSYFSHSFLRYFGPMRTVMRNMERRVDDFYIFPSKIPEGVPLYSITIPDNDFRNLNLILQNEENVLSDDARVWIGATFVESDRIYDVKMRVRGDQTNHWKYKKKSWRIKFKDDLLEGCVRLILFCLKTERGMQRF